MTDISKEAVDALLQGLTPSKTPFQWYVMKRYSFIAHKDTWQVVWDVPNSTALSLVADTGGDMFSDERDARFIAAARELVPALRAALDEAEARAVKAEAERDAANALLRQIADLTTQHGGAAQALKLIRAHLGGKP